MLYITLMLILISSPSLYSMNFLKGLMQYTIDALPSSLTCSSDTDRPERPSRRIEFSPTPTPLKRSFCSTEPQPTTHPIILNLLARENKKPTNQDFFGIVCMENPAALHQEPYQEPKTIVLFEESTFTDSNNVDRLEILNPEEEKAGAILSQIKEEDESIPQSYVFFRGGHYREMPLDRHTAESIFSKNNDSLSQPSKVSSFPKQPSLSRKYFKTVEDIQVPGYEEEITLNKHLYTGEKKIIFLQKAFKSHLKNIEKKFMIQDGFEYTNPKLLLAELDTLHKTFGFCTEDSKLLHKYLKKLAKAKN